MRRLITLAAALLGVSITLGSLGCATALSGPAQHPADKELVVMIHGLGRSNMAMWPLASHLEEAGYAVELVGYQSINRTADEVIAEVSSKIDNCCAEHPNAVHFVGHSMGGLLIRAYLQAHKPARLGRAVLVGTPNQGTQMADHFRDSWLVQQLSPVALALGTDQSSIPSRLGAPDYPVGVIAGVREKDNERIPGRDDGLVPVESTKLAGMSDFVEVQTGHSMMRHDDTVAAQVLSFLKRGKFVH